jgi:hypothetical protein
MADWPLVPDHHSSGLITPRKLPWRRESGNSDLIDFRRNRRLPILIRPLASKPRWLSALAY